jgi:hypothetical protein
VVVDKDSQDTIYKAAFPSLFLLIIACSSRTHKRMRLDVGFATRTHRIDSRHCTKAVPAFSFIARRNTAIIIMRVDMDYIDYIREKPSEEIIAILFTNTLIPFFSWCLGQLSMALLGCKLILIMHHPTKAYIGRVVDSWVKDNQLFSCSEILGFQAWRKSARTGFGLTFRFPNNCQGFLTF